MKTWVVLIIIGFVCCGTPDQGKIPETDAAETSTVRSVVMVIAHRDFRDEELAEPLRRFKQAGYRVVIASTDTTEAQGMLGMTIKPDITIEQIHHDVYEAIVVVGGTGCKTLWDDDALHAAVRDFYSAGKLVAAMCLAPVALGRAGVLTDLTVTAFPAVKDDIAACGAVYTGNDVEQCGLVITCSGPQAVQEFSESVLNTLRGE
jgi:protease I